MEIDQLAQAGKVEGTSGVHRRRDRDETSAQHRFEPGKNAILPQSPAPGDAAAAHDCSRIGPPPVLRSVTPMAMDDAARPPRAAAPRPAAWPRCGPARKQRPSAYF